MLANKILNISEKLDCFVVSDNVRALTGHIQTL